MAFPLTNANPTGETFTTPEQTLPLRSPEEMVREAIDRHGRVALAFSGGMESLLLLELVRSHRERVTVFWTNTGAMFPHMVDFVREAVRGFDFVEVRSDVRASMRRDGFPAKVLPVANTRDGATALRKLSGPLVRSFLECCGENRSMPMYRAIAQMHLTGVLVGQRAADLGLPIDRTFIAPEDARPLEFVTPLWGLTRDDVSSRLDAAGVALPSHYAEIPDSLECWACTQEFSGRADWMRRTYPDLAQIVDPIASDIQEHVVAALSEKPKRD